MAVYIVYINLEYNEVVLSDFAMQMKIIRPLKMETVHEGLTMLLCTDVSINPGEDLG